MGVRMSPEGGNLDKAVRMAAGRERLLVLGCLALMAVLGGAHLLTSPQGEAAQWSAAHGWLVFGMWAAVMAAIMAPGAGRSLSAYFAGHLALWAGLSAVVALAHWALHAAGLLTPGVATENPVAGGILLMCAGALQLTPLNAACFAYRRPVRFGRDQRRTGAEASFASGLRHALHAVGRCWPLMALLFVGGVMNPLWIVVLTPIAMAERILPYGASIANGVAVGAIGWGLWMLAGMLA